MSIQQALSLNALTLSVCVLSGCATTWPGDPGLPPDPATVPPPYAVSTAPRPAFEFETDRRLVGGPTFRAPTAGEMEQRRTAERLADFQRTTTPIPTQTEQLPRYAPPVMQTAPAPRPRSVETTPLYTARTEPLPIQSSGPIQSMASVPSGDVMAAATVPPMPAARPGECFALVRRAEQYRTVQRQVLVQPEYERLQVRPAQYEQGVENVVVQEAYERLEIVPATFKEVTERVMIRPPSQRLLTTEPEYETVTERILVEPARQHWKRGRGPIERLDHATGEIMCLVEEPAKYRTVTRRQLRTPSAVREVEVPAEYRTIRRRVLDQPGQVRRVTIPAQSQAMRVERLTSPSQVERVRVPARYETVAVQELAAGAQMEWRPVLCETNLNVTTIRSIQRALQQRGFDPGTVDGVLGRKTMDAINAYQRASGLPVDRYLNVETIRSLGLR